MPVPVISVAQMREWEKVTWASGVAVDAVMQRAGEAVARMAERLTRPWDRILFIAGKGHNGDDTVLAHEAVEHRAKSLLRVVDPERGGEALASLLAETPALIVDGLFGIGLNRPLSGAWLDFIERLNRSGVPVLAVDVPSGLSADTGLPLDVAVRAQWTLTLAAVKQGLLLPNAAMFTGRVEVARDIGLVPYPFTTELNWMMAEDFKNFPPARIVSGHKGTFGHLVIVAGSVGYHGAAVLAARGAHRAQPGLVSLCTTHGAYLPVASQLQATMVQGWDEALSLPKSCTAILLGPGLAGRDVPESLQRLVRRYWQDAPQAVIADATALDWLPEGPVPENAVRVMTPHPGEAGRLLRTSTAVVQENRPQAARELSRRHGNCHVVLKGHQTLVGRSKEELSVNSSGNPFLGQGGSGDLLAGYLAGLLAQPELAREADRAMRFAVWQHGAAADALLASRANFTIEDLAGVLGGVRACGGRQRLFE